MRAGGRCPAHGLQGSVRGPTVTSARRCQVSVFRNLIYAGLLPLSFYKDMFTPSGMSAISTYSVDYDSEAQSVGPANSPIHPLLGAIANSDFAWRAQAGSCAPSARAPEPLRLHAMCLGAFNPTF